MTPGAGSALACTPAKTFSKTRGTDGRMVGCVSARFATSLSTDSAKIISKPMPSHAALTTCAKECASGRNSITESSGTIGAQRARRACASYAQFPCVSITPLGSPVVPEV